MAIRGDNYRLVNTGQLDADVYLLDVQRKPSKRFYILKDAEGNKRLQVKSSESGVGLAIDGHLFNDASSATIKVPDDVDMVVKFSVNAEQQVPGSYGIINWDYTVGGKGLSLAFLPARGEKALQLYDDSVQQTISFTKYDWQNNQVYWARWRVEGGNKHYVKIWRENEPEPGDWSFSAAYSNRVPSNEDTFVGYGTYGPNHTVDYYFFGYNTEGGAAPRDYANYLDLVLPPAPTGVIMPGYGGIAYGAPVYPLREETKTNTKQQDGRARIERTHRTTQAGTARVTNVRSTAQNGRAMVAQVHTKQQNGRAIVTRVSTIQQNGRAIVVHQSTATQSGVARIQSPIVTNTTSRSGTANVKAAPSARGLEQRGVTNITRVLTSQQSGVAKITPPTVVNTATQLGRAFIRQSDRINALEQYGRAAIEATRAVTQDGRASIIREFIHRQTGQARITQVYGVQQDGRANIFRQGSTTQLGRARIDGETSIEQTGRANIQKYNQTVQTGAAKVSNPLPDKLPQEWTISNEKAKSEWESNGTRARQVWGKEATETSAEWARSDTRVDQVWADTSTNAPTDWERQYYD